MALQRRYSDLPLISREMDNLFGSLSRWPTHGWDFPIEPLRSSFLTDRFPKMNTYETDTHYNYEIELPGLDKEDINITENNGVVTVSGEKTVKKEKNENNYRSYESYQGHFHRSFKLPSNSSDKLNAIFNNGVLTLSTEKTENNGRQILIE